MRSLRSTFANRSIPLLAAVLAGLLAGGCSYSTRYVPQRADRLALTLDDGAFVLRQGRRTAPLKEAELGGFGRARTNVQEMLACDEASFDLYLLAQDNFEQAQLFDWGSVAALAVGLLALPSFPLMVWAAFALDLVADNQTAIGLAQVIDAMNRHNDVSACADLDRPAPTTAPTSTPKAPLPSPPSSAPTTPAPAPAPAPSPAPSPEAPDGMADDGMADDGMADDGPPPAADPAGDDA